MQILKKYILGFFLLILFGVSSFLIYLKLNPKKAPSNLIVGTGRIDGDLININTKYAGRIEKLYADESQKIKKGQLLAVLSSKEYKAQLDTINQQIKVKQKEIEAKKIELKILKESLPENVKKAKSSLEAIKLFFQSLRKYSIP
ncbi:biotin/lipoyl-binding protein [Hydrogenivirga sp. 128-5-R1-1]|uniref:biotin/lipoyl-binding protein n=1 Tax=Hydrogenivirga sp. 128-5-R1-1 TaxID=392423 RepID=UPI00015F1092|nr:biotin/lipoyl-binding protein [Hydrogenivirga sp. 128-5-R1-1]EDP74379.1 hypothetical protein HG1285_05320 [Hydrogenivirga sp. 128-5-R1-1]